MLRQALAGARGALQQWRMLSSRRSSTSVSSAVNSMLLRHLKEHYLELSKMTPPPKVSPPSPFTIVEGALDRSGPVLKRTYGDEEISLRMMMVKTVLTSCSFTVDISKPGQKESLHFLCGLYPDALGIHSVSMRPKLETSGFLVVPTKYNGPVFQDLDEGMRDALHSYIEERGINENLFPFLQAWLYVKDNRNLMRWFRAVGTLIKERKQASDA
ncbi:hypothetical protein HYC85_000237 [Camellia sinensis]|uniref:Mitochondrial glycoprotein n=1 Tax=Camellia sinensis TaxID=4442 RepID=A0A7J7I4H8_CAMSI|nr:hypothetical protein HYC85_000237 [Camellia sinensis]